MIIPPWKRAGPFNWTNLNPHHSRMLCAKFVWNWPGGSGEEDILNFVNVFSLSRNYFHSVKERGPWFEQTWISLTLPCAKFGWNSPVILEKKMKMLKGQRQRRRTDKLWSEKLTWAFFLQGVDQVSIVNGIESVGKWFSVKSLLRKIMETWPTLW